MKKLDEVYFSSRTDWRHWLINNHAHSSGVWLIYYKKGSDKPRISYDDAVEEALCFGWIDSLVKKMDEDRYCQKFTPRQAKSSWSDLNKQRIRKLEAAGLMALPGKNAVRTARENGSWDRETESRKQLDMPEELSEALSASKEAQAFFQSLSRSQQRRYIGWIGTAKHPETRQRRTGEALRMLLKKEKLGMK